MYKKIAIADVRVGMYLISTGLSWSESPFLYSAEGMLEHQEDIERLCKEGFREVIIDTDRGLDLRGAAGAANAAVEDLATLLARQAQHGPARLASLTQELPKARAAYAQSLAYARSFIHTIRLGKQVRVDEARPVIENMLASVGRNSDALLGLSKLRSADEYTYTHCINTAVLAMIFGRSLGLGERRLMSLGTAALFHDLGKASVPDAVLNKPGKLTEEEFAVIKRHPVYSQLLLSGSALDAECQDAVLHHHERIGGQGYPDGLSGEAVSPMAQVLGVVDVYDALTSRRAYKAEMPANKALGLMYGMRGKDFAPELMERFIKCLGIYPLGSLVRLDDGRVGVVCESAAENQLKPVVRLVADRSGFAIKPVEIDLATHPTRSIKECLDARQLGIDPAAYLLPQESRG